MLALYLLLFPSLAVSQSLVMIGGALNDANFAIYDKIVELAGGDGARIGVISIGSPFPMIQRSKVNYTTDAGLFSFFFLSFSYISC